MNKVALITGVTGQDGAYLFELLIRIIQQVQYSVRQFVKFAAAELGLTLEFRRWRQGDRHGD